jgi:Tfp pilus assembly protein PilF
MYVSRIKLVGVALVIFAGALWLYWPSVHGEFLAVDDVEYLRQSERWNGLTWNAVKWAFTCTDSYYHPLARLSHVLDYQIWGENAAGHHATSVFLHALNAALVFGLLWTLLGATSLSPGERLMLALWVAAVFAIHPLQVESVAWISGRTQLLCTMFCIGSIWAYTAGSRRWVVWGLYVGALLCKPMAVSLPFVMLAIDYYPLRRHEQLGWGRLVSEKAVWIALAAVVVVVTMITKLQHGGVVALSAGVPLSLRVLLMFKSLTFYPLKLVWPAHLSPSYPISWSQSHGRWPLLASVLSVLMITAAVILERRRWPMLAAAWGAYVVLVLPVSGLMLTAAQSVAQRHAYMAMLPLLLLAGGAGVWLWRRSPTVVRVVMVGLVAGQLGVFAVRTRGLIPDWHNEETMRRAEVVALPDSEDANRLFAMFLLDHGRAREALQYAQRDVEVAPQLWLSHLTLGHVLGQLGRRQEAMAQDEQALRMNPDFAQAHYNFGMAMLDLGKVPEAVEHFEQALRIKPDYAEAQNSLGNALRQAGKIEEAIAHYEQALRIKPDYAGAHNNLGLLLMQTGRIDEAIAHFEQALRIKPDYAEAHCALGMALEQAGQVREAIGHYEQALRIKPDLTQAQNALARLQVRQ